jgi:chemotaxis protein CheD
MVGMAEVKVSRSPTGVLMVLGLGSCVGVCAYDPRVAVAGLAHIVLPQSAGNDGNRNDGNQGKFADTGIPLLLEEMRQYGASPSRLRVALVGGAQLFAGAGTGTRLDIGPRNVSAVQAVLERHGIQVIATDLGGNMGRTAYLYGDGRVHVKTIGRDEKQLTHLAEMPLPSHKARPSDTPPQYRQQPVLQGAPVNPAYIRRARCG